MSRQFTFPPRPKSFLGCTGIAPGLCRVEVDFARQLWTLWTPIFNPRKHHDVLPDRNLVDHSANLPRRRLVYRGDFALGTLMRFLPIVTQIFLVGGHL